jgi:hypothetical protein
MTNIDWNIAIEAAAVVADDYAKLTWGPRHLSEEAAVAAEHIANSIRNLKVSEVEEAKPSIIGAAGHEALCPTPRLIEACGSAPSTTRLGDLQPVDLSAPAFRRGPARAR